MAKKLKSKFETFQNSLGGTIFIGAIYALMLLLVLIFFTGNGQFLYEL